MLLRTIDLENIGPIEKLKVDVTPLADGTERVILFVGANGSGKSIVIASVADAVIEAKRNFYSSLPDTKKDQFYKLLTKRLIRRGARFSLSKISFSDGAAGPVFTEFASDASDYATFQSANPTAQNVEPHFFGNGMRGLHKAVVGLTDDDPFRREILLYFPVHRFSLPFWLNAEAEFRLSKPEEIIGQTQENTVVENARTILEDWIIETVLDEKLLEYQQINLPIQGGHVFPVAMRVEGRNTKISLLLISFLKEIFEAKFGAITSIQILVGPKFSRSVAFQFEGATGTHVVNGLAEMSSGEVEALYLIGMILRYADRISAQGQAIDPTAVSGLVIIDEIEKHHHITLQQKILPRLIKLFPKIGFVVSTQSPFVPIALQEALEDRLQIFELPLGRKIGAEEFSEFKDVLDLMVRRFEQGKRDVAFLRSQSADIQKPRIYFEGKTDWKHIKAALHALGGYEGVNEADLIFVEDPEDRGDSRLLKMCENAAKLQISTPSVFVFDRDVAEVVRLVEDAGAPKLWSEHVVSFALPIPPHRIGFEYIAIEMLYRDEDLTLIDPLSGKRLVFSNEVTWTFEAGRRGKGKKTPTGGVIRTPDPSLETKKYIEDQDVSSLRSAEGQEVAHSKSRFADLVSERKPPFEAIDFAGFLPLFEKLKIALQMLQK